MLAHEPLGRKIALSLAAAADAGYSENPKLGFCAGMIGILDGEMKLVMLGIAALFGAAIGKPFERGAASLPAFVTPSKILAIIP
jgi:hypothetical protein